MGALPRLRSGAPRRLSSRSRRSLPSWPVLRRRLLLGLGLLLVVAAAYQFWFRSSSLVAVEDVTISGAERYPSIESSLRTAALEQSTLDFDSAALAQAVADEPAVLRVTARPDFPNGATVSVELREPVAALSGSALVAADGVLLGRDTAAAAELPKIELTSADERADGSLSGAGARSARVLGAAPGPLLGEVSSATVDRDYGVVVELDSGLQVRFGGAEDAALKWRAAAAVLTDPELGSPTYIDVTVAERPVAGGLAQEAVSAVESVPPPPDELPAEPAASGEQAPPAGPEAVAETPGEGGLATVE